VDSFEGGTILRDSIARCFGSGPDIAQNRLKKIVKITCIGSKEP